ncbi:MAG: hypothetical protein WAO95_01250 [Burkholderiales bacterium]
MYFIVVLPVDLIFHTEDSVLEHMTDGEGRFRQKAEKFALEELPHDLATSCGAAERHAQRRALARPLQLKLGTICRTIIPKPLACCH